MSFDNTSLRADVSATNVPATMPTGSRQNFVLAEHKRKGSTELNNKLNALVIAIACLLMLPTAVFAQFPSPAYGWNLGNTLEPPCGEGCWSPATTQALINEVAAAGFNTIRIPVAWDSHASQTAPYTIDASWLNRVKQVVDWSLAADLTVVINTHWDGGWLESNVGTTVNPIINAKMNSYWTQIANNFAGYDERLLFAAANEPNINYDELDNAAQMSTLTSYYQTFVNAVRGTGGSNTSRWLVVQGPNTDINLTDSLMNTLPSDPTEGRLAVEVHYYDPFQFTLMSNDEWWGNQFYFWGDDYNSGTLPTRNATHSEEAHLIAQLQKMHTKFVSQGVPVILGEFGAMNRSGNPELTGANLDLHLASRLYYHQLVVDTANSLGIAPFYWDNGWTGFNGFGIFNRDSATVFDQNTVYALTGGPGQPGDFNGDGEVDGRDFLIWQRNPSVGNLADWQANYGQSTLSASTAVPEPSACVYICLAALLLTSSNCLRPVFFVPRYSCHEANCENRSVLCHDGGSGL